MGRPPSDLNPGASPLALFGSELRRYRELAALSQEQLGDRINYSGSFVGQVERAEKSCDRVLALRADRALDTRDALTHLWDGLVRFSVFPSWFDWPIHEAAAIVLRTFQLSVVHGLLQTEDYARALLRGDEPAVQARMARQNILTRADPAPPYLVCVLDESALHREIGGPRVMREQLAHLVAAVSDRISVQVVPSRLHRGISGSFVLATLEDRAEVAYVETAAHGLTMAEPKVLTTLNRSFDDIRSQALPVDMSVDLITRTAEERWT